MMPEDYKTRGIVLKSVLAIAFMILLSDELS